MAPWVEELWGGALWGEALWGKGAVGWGTVRLVEALWGVVCGAGWDSVEWGVWDGDTVGWGAVM